MSNYRILVVDDVPSVCRGLRPVLRGTGQVFTASRSSEGSEVARDAIGIIRVHPPDIVVLDGLDGHAEEVVAACREARVPVVLFTAEIARYRSLGVPAVEKPEVLDLIQALRTALGGTDV